MEGVVRTETCTGLDSVLVDHTERSPAPMARVMVRCKRKGVVGVQPVVISVSALRPGPLGHLH